MKPMIVAITGASGIQYAIRFVQALHEINYPMELVISESARLVIREEIGIPLKSFNQLEDVAPLFQLSADKFKSIKVHSPKDFTASIASGSYPVSGMVILPCSMGTLGAIANGLSQNLIHRAADCVLKEGRRLVIVPRETPLSAIHLENMLKLAKLGVRIVPAMPGFYSGVQTVSEMVDFMVGKILDQLEIPHALYPRWTGTLSSQTLPEKS